MKIGILTLHSQINYGGVLQAYAMQNALKDMGHDTVIIDHWLTPDNQHLKGPFGKPFLQKIKYIVYALLGTGMFSCFQRHYRTIKFIQNRLKLSTFHFYNWSDIKPKIYQDFDCIIVGSDQVWHIYEEDFPAIYFLEGVKNIPAISYAASIGMKDIPTQFVERIQKGLANFASISVREKTAKEQVEALGFQATHVVDPTLLTLPKTWDSLSGKKQGKRLFCYFMEDDLLNIYPELDEYAQKTNSKIDIFLKCPYLVFLPITWSRLKKWWIFQKIKFFGNNNIRIHSGADPAEFVYYASIATDAVSDSFHALMFSVIFDLNIRILRPQNDFRQFMFSRIEEFTECVSRGTLIANNLHDALESIHKSPVIIFDAEKIRKKREQSKNWLLEALQGLSNKK